MREIGAPTKWVRRAITAVGIFTGTMTPAAAQQMGTMPLIAVLSTRTPEDGPTRAFIQQLGALGYIEGRNIRIEVRWARGDNEKIPTLAAELAAAKPRVIVTNGEPGIRAAKAAITTDTPIVMANVGDPVAAGFVKTLA